MTLNATTHKNILIKILKDIFTDHALGPILGFKGGTAAYLFYDLSRFSVDLDFDLLEESKEDFVFEEIRKILEKYGTIKESTKKRFNLFYLLSYDDKVPGAQNIKVEINRREFGSKYEVKSYLGISMKVMVKEDMAAHKLVAMYERIGKANRDIFDVWFFLEKNWPVNKEIVEARTGMLFKDFLKRCIEVLEKMDDKNILAGMGELLDAKQKDWAKAKLRTDTIFLLKQLIEFSPEEVNQIEKTLNETFLSATGYAVKNLKIKHEDKYFFESSDGRDTSAYVISLELERNGEPVELSATPFTVKASLDKISYQIAFEIWSKYEQSNKNSLLWKRL